MTDMADDGGADRCPAGRAWRWRRTAPASPRRPWSTPTSRCRVTAFSSRYQYNRDCQDTNDEYGSTGHFAPTLDSWATLPLADGNVKLVHGLSTHATEYVAWSTVACNDGHHAEPLVDDNNQLRPRQLRGRARASTAASACAELERGGCRWHVDITRTGAMDRVEPAFLFQADDPSSLAAGPGLPGLRHVAADLRMPPPPATPASCGSSTTAAPRPSIRMTSPSSRRRRPTTATPSGHYATRDARSHHG